MEGCHGKLPVVSPEPQMKFILVLVAIIERGNYTNAYGQHREYYKCISANISRIEFVGKFFHDLPTRQMEKKGHITLVADDFQLPGFLP
jgi:hypothetical protein